MRLVAAVVGVPFLILAAVEGGEAAAILGASIFGLTLVMVFLTSTLYHAVTHAGAKPVLRIIDHCAIFLLIAGTYTPFTLRVLRGGWRWRLFGIVWGLGLAGVLLKIVRGARHPRLSIALYLAVGRLMVVAIKPLWETFPVVAAVAAGRWRRVHRRCRVLHRPENALRPPRLTPVRHCGRRVPFHRVAHVRGLTVANATGVVAPGTYASSPTGVIPMIQLYY